MTTRHRDFERASLPDELTAVVAIALWKEAHPIKHDPEFLLHPGELHGVTPPLSGHLGRPMLKRARRRALAQGELSLV